MPFFAWTHYEDWGGGNRARDWCTRAQTSRDLYSYRKDDKREISTLHRSALIWFVPGSYRFHFFCKTRRLAPGKPAVQSARKLWRAFHSGDNCAEPAQLPPPLLEKEGPAENCPDWPGMQLTVWSSTNRTQNCHDKARPDTSTSATSSRRSQRRSGFCMQIYGPFRQTIALWFSPFVTQNDCVV